MRKVMSPTLGPYWLSPSQAKSPDGFPVFTNAEVDLIKKSKDTLPDEMLKKIYELKQIMEVDMTNLSKTAADQIQAALFVTTDERPENTPRQEIGTMKYTGVDHKKEMAKKYSGEILENLRRNRKPT